MYTLRGKELDVILIEINGRHLEPEDAVIGVITRSRGEIPEDELAVFIAENAALLIPMVVRTHIQWIAEEAIVTEIVVH
jgi:hypothetical protein